MIFNAIMNMLPACTLCTCRRITHRGESTPGSAIAPIPFNLSAEGAEMWGALHDGEGNAIKGTRGRDSGGRREAGTLRSDSLMEATEQEVCLASTSSSQALMTCIACFDDFVSLSILMASECE